MGLSTKQVPGDQALDWSQTLLESAGTVVLPKPPPVRRQSQQQQQSEPLNCPRCGSTNTKFCYYNNYNKSQPRHFCKACKRHWTKGGTLRNVPIGGGRKNKRLKASSAARGSSATATSITIPTSTSDRNNVHVVAQNQQDSHFPLPALGDQKSISDLYQALINSSSSVRHDPINAFTSKTSMGNKGTSSGPMLSLPQDQNLQSSFSSLSPFDNIPSPIPSFNQSLNGYDYIGKIDSMESSTVTTVTPAATSCIFSEPWQGPTTSSVMAEMPNYWNWNDIDTFVSADLNIPWDDTEIKP